MKKTTLFFLILPLFAVMILWHACTSDADFAIKVENLDISELKEYAEEGNSDAQTELGARYRHGELGVEIDTVETINWYRKALDQGNVYAKYRIALCYDDGFGVKKDSAKANALFKEALTEFTKMAEDGDIKAQCYIGMCYDNGRGTKINKKKAFEAYMKSAEKGYAKAQCNIGSRYFNGKYVKKSYTEAVKWYEKAADQGDSKAQYNLGFCYYNGYGIRKSLPVAAAWYEKSAERGNVYAQLALGSCYYYGEGEVQSYTEAVKWFRIVAEKGYASAQYNLGLCYKDGEGVTQSKTEAIKWLKKAADQGYITAINELLIYTTNSLDDVDAETEKSRYASTPTCEEHFCDTIITKYEFENSKHQKYKICIRRKDGVCYIYKGYDKTGNPKRQMFTHDNDIDISKQVSAEYGIKFTYVPNLKR